MTPEKATEILRWHAENSTQGKLVLSCKANHEFEEAYRTIYGQAPTYRELQEKIRKSAGKRYHSIIQFKCTLLSESKSEKVWFCSDECRHLYSAMIVDLHNRECSSLIERFCCLKHNEDGQCARCEKKPQ